MKVNTVPRLLHLSRRIIGGYRQSHRAFDPEMYDIRDAYKRAWKGVPCVFVLSTGRCGTNTIAELWNLARGIVACHEPIPKLLNASHSAYMSKGGQFDHPIHWDSVVDAGRSELIWRAYARGNIYGESSNRLTYLAPTLAHFYPDSKFIFLHRDPIEVVRSGLQRNWYGGNHRDWARIKPREDDHYFLRWSRMTQIEKNAWYWQAVNRFSLEFIAKMPTERVLEVRAKDLFEGNSAVIDEIFSFTGVPTPSQSSIRKVIGQKINANGPSRAVLLPERFSEEELDSIQEVTGPVARALGY